MVSTAQINFSASLNDSTSVESSVGYLSFDGNVPRVDISTSSSMFSPVHDRPSPSLMFASARLPLGSLSGSKPRPVFSMPAHSAPQALLLQPQSGVATSNPLTGVAGAVAVEFQSGFGQRQPMPPPMRHTFVHFSTQQSGMQSESPTSHFPVNRVLIGSLSLT